MFSWWIDIVRPTNSFCFLLSFGWVAWCFFTLNSLAFSIFGESNVRLSCVVTLYNWNNTWMTWEMQISMEIMCECLNSKWRKRQWRRNENIHVNRVTIGYRLHFKFLEFKCWLNIFHNNSIYLIKKLLAGVDDGYMTDRKYSFLFKEPSTRETLSPATSWNYHKSNFKPVSSSELFHFNWINNSKVHHNRAYNSQIEIYSKRFIL